MRRLNLRKQKIQKFTLKKTSFEEGIWKVSQGKNALALPILVYEDNLKLHIETLNKEIEKRYKNIKEDMSSVMEDFGIYCHPIKCIRKIGSELPDKTTRIVIFPVGQTETDAFTLEKYSKALKQDMETMGWHSCVMPVFDEDNWEDIVDIFKETELHSKLTYYKG